jgi:hypothetical protein
MVASLNPLVKRLQTGGWGHNIFKYAYNREMMTHPPPPPHLKQQNMYKKNVHLTVWKFSMILFSHIKLLASTPSHVFIILQRKCAMYLKLRHMHIF